MINVFLIEAVKNCVFDVNTSQITISLPYFKTKTYITVNIVKAPTTISHETYIGNLFKNTIEAYFPGIFNNGYDIGLLCEIDDKACEIYSLMQR